MLGLRYHEGWFRKLSRSERFICLVLARRWVFVYDVLYLVARLVFGRSDACDHSPVEYGFVVDLVV